MTQQLWSERRFGNSNNRPGDQRTPWQRDRARILHSAAFRRLQSKTQILGIGQNDFYRTRLTHSLEAAQIGTGLVSQLRSRVSAALVAILPDDSLMEALCLAHDIGHPPFGHGGETALNFKMLHAGGFEGNGQTLRIVAKLEPYTLAHGMDLSRRTLLGLLKYPVLQPDLHQQPLPGINPLNLTPWQPAKAIFAADADILDWILAPLSTEDRALFQSTEQLDKSPYIKSRYKSLDASIMELADDIAYGVHDLEDAIVLGNISQAQWQQHTTDDWTALPKQLQPVLQQIGSDLFSNQHHLRKDAIGSLVNMLISAVTLSEVLPQAEEPLVRYNATLAAAPLAILQCLKQLVYRCVILKPDIQQSRFRCQNMLMALFDAFSSDPARLLPANTQLRWQQAENEQKSRVICDYISGMTDDYAEHMYRRLYASGV
ncbi:MAG: deoxyguanosinetriphosphate triphosphohydrolase family protein [Gammaproteobacteria bacterium]|nr:deoxyguanosinetriphosphate triphosphohydrolase family protein [Gammaproteobacteria bacterium]MBU2072509.1 deoxyguanosinetriphosphate triphosphohydrolase family protein [Gammaproteobacteria bacterium]MBU2181941.1 deoxyguanosinetriphosphate triphosphohydrolase family protein [Gammaproteobacteria bacterium]MBU2204247.1 deoxyguanosinetriphosphate triphosphohydrolase family protein [Gammaproteobacteria bacterium]